MSRLIRLIAQKREAERAVEDKLKHTERHSTLIQWIESSAHHENPSGYSMTSIQSLAPTLSMNAIAKILVEHGFTKSRKETPLGFLRLWHPPKLSG